MKHAMFVVILAAASTAHAERAPRGPDFVAAHAPRALDRSLAASDGAGVIAPSDELFFAPGSAELDPDAAGLLDDTARWLRAHPRFHLAVEGHAELQADADATQSLAERRAERVRAELARRGISNDRILVLVSREASPRVAIFASDQPVYDIASDALDTRGELVERWTERGTRFQLEPGVGVTRHPVVATRR
ncbi:MAG TPA: OmpA family protein [Kofleriaceae bacterium]|jgi:hypothetical protein